MSPSNKPEVCDNVVVPLVSPPIDNSYVAAEITVIVFVNDWSSFVTVTLTSVLVNAKPTLPSASIIGLSNVYVKSLFNGNVPKLSTVSGSAHTCSYAAWAAALSSSM